MKRGIVMDLNKRKAVVLTKDGEFKKVPLKKYPYVAIGEEVVVPGSSTFPIYSKSIPALSAVAAAAIFLIILLSSFPLSTSESAVAAFVGLDINPSVEAGINQQLEVIELKALNEDGNKIISKIGSFDEMPLQQLLTTFLAASKSAGYLENSKDMLVTTTYMDDKSTLEEPIAKAVGSWQEENVATAGIAVTTMIGNRKQRQKAQDSGLSTGKYLMYLQSKDHAQISLDEVKSLSVEQLNDRLKPSKSNETIDVPKNKEDEKEVPAAVESVGQEDSKEESVNETTEPVTKPTSKTSGAKVDSDVKKVKDKPKSSEFAPIGEDTINNAPTEPKQSFQKTEWIDKEKTKDWQEKRNEWKDKKQEYQSKKKERKNELKQNMKEQRNEWKEERKEKRKERDDDREVKHAG